VHFPSHKRLNQHGIIEINATISTVNLALFYTPNAGYSKASHLQVKARHIYCMQLKYIDEGYFEDE
jgi:hypothetical protein